MARGPQSKLDLTHCTELKVASHIHASTIVMHHMTVNMRSPEVNMHPEGLMRFLQNLYSAVHCPAAFLLITAMAHLQGPFLRD